MSAQLMRSTAHASCSTSTRTHAAAPDLAYNASNTTFSKQFRIHHCSHIGRSMTRWQSASHARLTGCFFCYALQVPAVILLAQGPETQTITAVADTTHPLQGSAQTHSKHSTAPHSTTPTKPPQIPSGPRQQADAHRAPTSCRTLALAVIGQGCLVAALLVLLVYMSDWAVQGLEPPAACMPHVLEWLRPVLPWTRADRQDTTTGSQVPESCWAHTVYRLHILVEDQTPNIGQFWYLFTEMFSQYLALFRYGRSCTP